MSTPSRWLNWTPCKAQIIEDSPKMEPTKPTKPSFDSFDGSVSRDRQIIHSAEPGQVKQPSECPYALPEGVKLVRFEGKAPPVAVTVCSVVTDVPKFIRHALGELDARLHSPIQIKAGDSVFELLSKLADCGLDLRFEWPRKGRVIENPPEAEPSKPAKLQELPETNPDISDEDVPF